MIEEGIKEIKKKKKSKKKKIKNKKAEFAERKRCAFLSLSTTLRAQRPSLQASIS
jgi:hypothetical protein